MTTAPTPSAVTPFPLAPPTGRTADQARANPQPGDVWGLRTPANADGTLRYTYRIDRVDADGDLHTTFRSALSEGPDRTRTILRSETYLGVDVAFAPPPLPPLTDAEYDHVCAWMDAADRAGDPTTRDIAALATFLGPRARVGSYRARRLTEAGFALADGSFDVALARRVALAWPPAYSAPPRTSPPPPPPGRAAIDHHAAHPDDGHLAFLRYDDLHPRTITPLMAEDLLGADHGDVVWVPNGGTEG